VNERERTVTLTGLPPVPADVESLDAAEVLAVALDGLGSDRVALASSMGAEDMVILDLLAGLVARPRVFTLDTGRLPAETYDLIDASRRRYGVEVEVFAPQADRVQELVRSRGVNLFYESIENRKSCCEVRKVEPLGRALATVDGWITGLRRTQIVTREATAKIALDEAHGGIWKIAPLADWTEERVWAYIRRHDVPYNALHDQGYRSIGCAPCTRAVLPGEDERAGRWWWEQPTQRECGIHFDPTRGRVIRTERPAPSLGPFDAVGPAGGPR
jgi:phosphoadenosine phosphosulfate reductase